MIRKRKEETCGACQACETNPISRQSRLGRGPGDEGRAARDVDVRSRLAEFAAGLDGGWMEEAAECALDYLTTCDRHSGYAAE